LAAGAWAVPFFEVSTQAGITGNHLRQNPQKCLRDQYLDRLVQWMVQDASLDR
jgi:hypothetical protein